jgi:hypothetical protein
MIRVSKPTAPAVLVTRGATATIDLHAEYDRNPAAYRKGTKHFAFN